MVLTNTSAAINLNTNLLQPLVFIPMYKKYIVSKSLKYPSSIKINDRKYTWFIKIKTKLYLKIIF